MSASELIDILPSVEAPNKNEVTEITEKNAPYTGEMDVLFISLMQFYHNAVNFNTFANIISGKSRISLRLVDWFVTNFAKQYYTIIIQPPTSEKHEATRFKVYNQYKQTLPPLSKMKFDPFCRGQETLVVFPNGAKLETNIKQMNFFKWAIENHIVAYIEEHFDEIDRDMNKRNSTSKRKKTVIGGGTTAVDGNNKTRKKREELSNSHRTIIFENVKTTFKFT